MHQPTETTSYYQHPTYQPPNPPTAPPAPSPQNYHLTPPTPNPNPNYPPPNLNPNLPPYNHNQFNQTQSLNHDYSNFNSSYDYSPAVSSGSNLPGQNPAPYGAPTVPIYDNNGGYGDQGGNYGSSVSPRSYPPGHNSAPNSGQGVPSYDNSGGYSGYGDQGGNLSSTVLAGSNSSGSYAPGLYAPANNSAPNSGPGASSYDHLYDSNLGYSKYGGQGGNLSSSESLGSYRPGHNSAMYSTPAVPRYDSNGGYGGYGGQGGNLSPSGLHSSGSYAPPGHNSAPFSAPIVSSYDNRNESSVGYGGYGDKGDYGSGVYKYSGGKKTVDVGYGGGKGREESSGSVLFDDYGRPISGFNGREQSGGINSKKIVKAVPKVEEHTDVKSGVQKYRVKLLSEGYGQPEMDVLCQIGLDGIRILEPSTGRMLKIYTLETVTRWEVLDSYIFAFWAKTSVDAEPRRIRLKSNSYTTNNILDTVTAASIQVKEIGASKTSESTKETEQPSEKKKGITDWVNFIKPGNEEKDHWVPDEAVAKCTACGGSFSAFNRRHHCRNCGDVFCDKCTHGRIALTADENAQPVRVCDQCMAEVTQRLSNTKEAAVRVTGLQSHEDLAKKLQEVMNINRKKSSGSVSGGSRTQMRDVACPTCTVHLQVQVPASGSETIECSVCQQPFLVSAH